MAEETTTRKNSEKTPKFVCEKCDFKCCKQNEYRRHYNTIKHKRLHETTKKTPNTEQKSFVCICGKKYNHHSSLAKHKRMCIAVNTPVAVCEDKESNTIISNTITITTKDVNTYDEKDDATNNEPLTIEDRFFYLMQGAEKERC